MIHCIRWTRTGRGSEAHGHRETAAGGPDPAEAEEGVLEEGGEGEEEEDTVTVLVLKIKATAQGWIQKIQSSQHLVLSMHLS